MTDPTGYRRLDKADDFIRLEIIAALKRNVLVIPALVGGAQMPGSDDLPEDLKPLARRQAYELSDNRWADDCRNLAKALRPLVRRRRGHAAKLTAGALILALVGGGLGIKVWYDQRAGLRRWEAVVKDAVGKRAPVEDKEQRRAEDERPVAPGNRKWEGSVNRPTVQVRWCSSPCYHPIRGIGYEAELRLGVTLKQTFGEPSVVEGLRVISESDSTATTWEGLYESASEDTIGEREINARRSRFAPFTMVGNKVPIIKLIDFLSSTSAPVAPSGTYKCKLQMKDDSSADWRDLFSFTFSIPSNFQLHGRDENGVEFYRYGYWQVFPLDKR